MDTILWLRTLTELFQNWYTDVRISKESIATLGLAAAGFDLKLDIHHEAVLHWTNNVFVFHSFKLIDLAGSYTNVPKRTIGCFDHPYSSSRQTDSHPPSLPHTGNFRFWGEHTLIPALISHYLAHSSSPTLPHTQW
ncbi:hypothetical protein AVEN_203426-1 [Araneus ventricosus]|uniref:Uncharacterized protein n=1 Tax=Araneus ventricosus TaxID=182803 RepID=A0A4Y2U334_ARAVE|nr:hypothetical protein AVEN_203426-1 [Araneus ventricosus]